MDGGVGDVLIDEIDTVESENFCCHEMGMFHLRYS